MLIDEGQNIMVLRQTSMKFKAYLKDIYAENTNERTKN